jgi:hypothetical protein
MGRCSFADHAGALRFAASVESEAELRARVVQMHALLAANGIAAPAPPVSFRAGESNYVILNIIIRPARPGVMLSVIIRLQPAAPQQKP